MDQADLDGDGAGDLCDRDPGIPQADLVGSISGPSSACAGDAIAAFSAQIVTNNSANTDVVATPFFVSQFLSTDLDINPQVDQLLIGGRDSLSDLSAGETVQVPLGSLEIPVTASAGAYFLGLYVDETDVLVESNGTNNTSAVPITVLEPTDPACDSDGDGEPDITDAFPNDPTETADSDGDGLGDNAEADQGTDPDDPDPDGDGINDLTDNCPNVGQ